MNNNCPICLSLGDIYMICDILNHALNAAKCGRCEASTVAHCDEKGGE